MSDLTPESLQTLPQNGPTHKAISLYPKAKTVWEDNRKPFAITPQQQLNKQLRQLENMRINRLWNGKLRFQNFWGAFKIEYWMQIEELLRFTSDVKKISFHNCQLDLSHLHVLKDWLAWLQAAAVEIVFKHNELDDNDLHSFLMDSLSGIVSFRLILIISNPGVFRGSLIQTLESKINRTLYHLEVNEKYKSLAIIRYADCKDYATYLDCIKRKMCKTQYISLNLDRCFNRANCDAFRYLISQCYHEDHLEQLMSLSVADCYLQIPSLLPQLCKSIATSKGLLSLNINGVSELNLEACNSLMGDRYDRLRLNRLSTEHNSALNEKIIKSLVDNVISQSCKQWDFANTFTQELPVLVKLNHVVIAFKEQLKRLQGTDQMLDLEELDLSTVDNYNQVALIKGILENVVFNERSSVKRLVLQNLDDGRANALTSTMDAYRKRMSQLKNHKPALEKVEIHSQYYGITTESMESVVRKLFFTSKSDPIQIKKLIFRSNCFENETRKRALENFFNSITSEERFSIQEFEGQQLSIDKEMADLMIKHLLFSINFRDLQICKLDFGYSSELNLEVLYENSRAFYESGLISNLKVLSLKGYYLEFEAEKLFRYLLMHPNISLTHLCLSDCAVSMAGAIPSDLPMEKQTLQKLKLIDCRSQDDGLVSLVKTVLANPFQNIKCLTVTNMIDLEMDVRLDHLEKLKLLNITENWLRFTKNFIANAPKLEAIKFKSCRFDKSSTNAFEVIFQQLQVDKQSLGDRKKITSVVMIECSVDGDVDFFSFFFVNSACTIRDFKLKACYGIETAFQTSLIQMRKLKQNLTARISTLELRQSNAEVSESLVELVDILLHKDLQELQTLAITDCNLNGPSIINLASTLKALKQHYQEQNEPYKFQLIHLDLSGATDIESQQWKQVKTLLFQLFQSLLHQTTKETPASDSQSQEQNQKDYFEILVGSSIKFISNTKLDLNRKINSFPQLYVPNYPQQLREVDVQFPIDYEKPDNNQIAINRFFKSLIFSTQSNVRKVRLSGVNFTQLEIATQQTRVLEQSQIQQLFISNADSVEEVQIVSFFKYYLSNLQVLSVHGYSGNFLSALANQMSLQPSLLHLHTLKISESYETIEVQDSENFVKHILLSPKLKVLKIRTGSITIYFDENAIIEAVGKSSAVSLERLTIRSDSESLDVLLDLAIPKIMATHSFAKLSINSFRSKEQLVDSFDLLQANCALTHLYVKRETSLNRKLLDFLEKQAKTLKKVKLLGVNLCDQEKVDEYLKSGEPVKLNFAFQTTISTYESSGLYIIQNFYFGKKLQWADFNYRQLAFLELLNAEDLSEHLPFDNLKSFELSCGLEQFSNEYLQASTLQMIGELLIFNTNSKVSDIKLNYAHLTPTQVEALTSTADSFREKLEQQGLQGSARLSLKKFTLYYSTKLAFEGFSLISQKILFNEYIDIERIEIEVTNLNDACFQKAIQDGTNWLSFQRKHKRSNHFRIRHLDFGRNDLMEESITFYNFFKTFVMTNNSPNLQVLFIHFLSMKDHQAFAIADACKEYLDSKPRFYRSPIKEINISYNPALSSTAWRALSENLLFHPQVDLIELNLYENKIITQEIHDAIWLPAQAKAANQGGTLKLQSLVCNNLILKNHFFHIMAKVAVKDAFYPNDLPYSKGEDYGFGEISGFSNSYGVNQQNVSKLIYTQESFICKDIWSRLDDLKCSEYHLRLLEHYVQPLCENKSNVKLVFSYPVLDELLNYFIIDPDSDGSPYPVSQLFPKNCQLYYNKLDIKSIIFVNKEFSRLELPDQFQILRIFEQLKGNKNNIDYLQIDYYLNDDLIDSMFEQGYTEDDIVQMIRLIPPCKMRIENSLTLQAIKAIYSIQFDNKNFQYSIIQYDRQNFLNCGIGYSVRQVIYNLRARTKVMIVIKKILYIFFSFFVQNAQQYKFSKEIKAMNQSLKSALYYFDLIALSTLIYFFMCIGMPLLLTSQLYDIDKDRATLCKIGTNPIATYSYYGFAVISLCLEGLLYSQIVQLIPSHAKKIVEVNIEEDEEEGLQIAQNQSVTQMQNKVQPVEEDNVQKALEDFNRSMKSLMKQLNQNLGVFANSDVGKKAALIKDVILGQFAKYDLYNDIVFIMQCYFCEESKIFTAALIVTCVNLSLYLYYYGWIMYRRFFKIKQQRKQLSTQMINDYFTLGIVGRNVALSQMLDNVAPYNVSTFVNNRFMRYMFPQLAGKSINNTVKVMSITYEQNYLFKFLIEDVPQIILQLLFIISQSLKSSGALGWNIYVTIATSSITILLSLLKFMQIRPSTISQLDFDEQQIPNEQINENSLKFLKMELEQLKEFTSLNCSENIMDREQ